MVNSFKVRVQTKYPAFTMIEMLVSLLIISILMVLMGNILTSISRASAVATVRSETRQATVMMLNVISKYLRNTEPSSSSVNLVSQPLTLNPETLTVGNYSSSMSINKNIVYVRPLGSDKWVCFGRLVDVNDNTKGYLVRGSVDASDKEHCFDASVSSITILNPESMNVTWFNVTSVEDADNVYFFITLKVTPQKWPGNVKYSKPEYVKTVSVSTRKIVY